MKISIKKHIPAVLVGMLIAGLVMSLAIPAAAVSRTYTLDADFDEGILVGTEHDTVHDQLQLNKTAMTLPFIWVPNSPQGTISKVNTTDGRELGRYYVAPPNIPIPSGGSTNGNPSRTTVDLLGNVWVGNREAGTVVKVGLYEAGLCTDRNGNGTIETSLDTNNDGNITGPELLAWGADECVLYEVVLIPKDYILGAPGEGTFAPGTYPGPYDTAYWGVAPRGLAIDASNNLWAGTSSTSKYYYIDGTTGAIIKNISVAPWGHNAYGAVIDKNGILWSAHLGSHVLRINTSNLSDIMKIPLGHTYGLGLDFFGNLLVGGNSQLSKINTSNGSILWTKSANAVQGVTATADNNVWVAGNYLNKVTRYTNDGNLVAEITGFLTPSGVAVDNAGKVWGTDLGSEYIRRIDPATNTIDLSKRIIGGGSHYTYSDMTGFVARSITTKIGTWTVIFDGGAANTPWGTVSWNSNEPAGTSVTVKVRSSNNIGGPWSALETATNGVQLSSTPNGRYLQIQATLQIQTGDVSPILYDLTVATLARGSISGMKFNDLNGNGTKDTGEPGLENWEITLTNESSSVMTMMTNASGMYTFTELPDGSYIVGETLKTGWTQTAPPTGTYTVEIKGGNKVTDKDFGNMRLPPEAACIETVNPAGKHIPTAGANPSSGQNPDGFYQLLATDMLDPKPMLYVKDTGSDALFGPFVSGIRIKYTEANGAEPVSKTIGGPDSAVDWHIKGNGDAAVYAVNDAGVKSPLIYCRVPPPPK